MTFKLNPRWLAAVLIWLAALMVSHLNFTEIQKVRSIRENNDRLRREMLFQHRYAAQLDQIRSIQAARSLPVASAKLGFEFVRSRLFALASGMGFGGVTIDSQMEQATLDRLPFRLNMNGSFEKTINFIAALRALPFLSLKKSRVQVAGPKPDAAIELDLDFRFTIAPVRQLGIPPLQAAVDPAIHKAVAR